jgi:hypothetical protein
LILPHWDSRTSRENFHRAALEAIEQALARAPSKRVRRSFVREAIYTTLERFGLVKRTRGGRPLPGPNPEGERSTLPLALDSRFFLPVSHC